MKKREALYNSYSCKANDNTSAKAFQEIFSILIEYFSKSAIIHIALNRELNCDMLIHMNIIPYQTINRSVPELSASNSPIYRQQRRCVRPILQNIIYEVFIMAKTAVLFKSNYGSTKQYALHIAEALEADLFDMSRVKKFDFDKYDTFIFGGGIYASKVNGIKFIASNEDKLSNKNLVVYTVGLGDPTIASNAKMIMKSLGKALPKTLMSRVHIYSFRGGLDWNKLKFSHRMIMKMLNSMLSKKKEEELTDEDRNILDNYGKAVDLTNMESSAALIEYVKSLN